MSNSIPLFLVPVVALLLAGIFLLAVRAGLRNSLLLLLAVAPPVLIYLWNQDLRVYSHHGLLHTSIVYRILNDGLPPDCPVLAGEPLYYPWGHHLLVAAVVAALGVSPFNVFAVINILTLVLTVMLMFKTGRLLYASREAGIFAAALSVYGLTPFNYSALFRPLEELTGWNVFTLRNIVVVNKFTTLQNNALGFLFFGLFLYSVVSLFSKPEPRKARREYWLLCAAVVGAGFFYPITWLAMGATGGAMLGVLWWRRGRELLPVLIRLAVAMAAGALLVAPYLFVISSGKSKQMFLIAPDLFFLFTKAVGWLWMTSPMALLLYWKRREMARFLRERGDLVAIAATPVAVTALMYVVIGTYWHTNEYKFINLSCFSLGLFASAAMAAVWREHKFLSFVLISILFVPLTVDWLGKADRSRYVVSDPYVLEGSDIHHTLPEQDRLYRWIRGQTDLDAVFLDTQLTVPAFARRRLYIPIDDRRAELPPGTRNGWNVTPDLMMDEYFAYSRPMVDERNRVAREVLSATDSVPERDLAELRSVGKGHGVYAIARRDEVRRNLELQHGFREVFRDEAAAVFLVEGSLASGGGGAAGPGAGGDSAARLQ
jgi:hypothetical protein